MSGLRSRIARLEDRLGTDDSPKRVLICYGACFRRHGIERSAGDTLHFTVPCPEDGDPMECLSPEQRSLIGPHDAVVCFEGFDDGRDRLEVITMGFEDNGFGAINPED